MCVCVCFLCLYTSGLCWHLSLSQWLDWPYGAPRCLIWWQRQNAVDEGWCILEKGQRAGKSVLWVPTNPTMPLEATYTWSFNDHRHKFAFDFWKKKQTQREGWRNGCKVKQIKEWGETLKEREKGIERERNRERERERERKRERAIEREREREREREWERGRERER